MADYIPRSDADFNLWQASLIDIINFNLTNWAINANDFTALTTTQTNWTAAFAKANNKQNRTSADVQAKDDFREGYEKGLRKFVAQWLANNSNVANSERERMGLTIKSGSHTPVPVPATSPIGTIDFSVRFQHKIHYSDQASPNSKAKPAGVHGCEIWMKIDGAPPVEQADLTYIVTDTRPSYTKTFEGKYAGKTIYYWLRWVNKRGEAGPWSSAISAIVAS